jgi:hypothetical protein
MFFVKEFIKNRFLPLIIRPRGRKQYINVIKEAQLLESVGKYNRFIFASTPIFPKSHNIMA